MRPSTSTRRWKRWSLYSRRTRTRRVTFFRSRPMPKTIGRIIDGDGHLLEDYAAIGKRMPKDFYPERPKLMQDLFPRDHLHSAQPLRMLKGSFERVGPEGLV